MDPGEGLQTVGTTVGGTPAGGPNLAHDAAAEAVPQKTLYPVTWGFLTVLLSSAF